MTSIHPSVCVRTISLRSSPVTTVPTIGQLQLSLPAAHRSDGVEPPQQSIIPILGHLHRCCVPWIAIGIGIAAGEQYIQIISIVLSVHYILATYSVSLLVQYLSPSSRYATLTYSLRIV